MYPTFTVYRGTLIDCESRGATVIHIPGDVRRIPSAVFTAATDIEELYFSYGTEVIEDSAFYECRNLKKVVLPASLKRIGPQAFSRCHALEEIIIPSSVTIIDANAFADCKNLKHIRVHGILSSLSSRGGIFAFCPNLEYVAMPSETKLLAPGMFNQCPKLRTIDFLGEEEPQLFMEDGMLYNIDRTTLYGYTGYLGRSVVIPEGVKTIGMSAFMISVDEVTLPSTLENIKDLAFGACFDLKSIKFPNGLRRIGRSAFRGCGIQELNLPHSVEHMGWSAFKDCGRLTKATLSDKLTKIPERAFDSCFNLEAVNFGKNTSVIEEDAFVDCNLSSVKLPPKIKTVAENAFDADVDIV